jgi:hypothetical protein
LNKLPQLKSFLKDGEAESYVGVTVEYIHGRRAVLTIYEDEEELEKITLSDYATKEEMLSFFLLYTILSFCCIGIKQIHLGFID